MNPLPAPNTFSRRQLLRRMGYAIGAVSAGHLLSACRSSGPARRNDDRQSPQVIILGAGLAGLCAAYELERKGFHVTLLEAEKSHVGGRARTLRFAGGRYGEAGAMRIPAKHDLTRGYCKELGLTLRPFVQSNPNAWLFARGTKARHKDEATIRNAFNLKGAEAAKSSDDLWAAVVVDRLNKMSPAEKADLLSSAPATPEFRATDQLSLQQLFNQSGLSQDAIEFMATMQGQEAEMQYACTESLREEMKEVWAHEFDEIVGGTDTLATAFARRLKSEIRMGCEVISVEQTPQAARVIYRRGGSLQTLEAAHVLCTLPVPVMQRLDNLPTWSPEKQRAIRQLTYDSATKVLIGARRRFWELDDGIYGGGTFTDLPSASTYYPSDNATDRAGTGPRDAALSHTPSIFLASYSWGMTARRLGALPHAQRLALVRRQLSKVHPQLADDSQINASASWAWDTHRWSGGAFAWFNPGQHATLYANLIAPEGRVHFAGEHASLSHTWMQGAFESALRAVQEIASA